MGRPEDSTVRTKRGCVLDTEREAAKCIDKLDGRFGREDAEKIAKWIYYLSTQA